MGKFKILIVDDSDINRMLLKNIFNDCIVFENKNGKDAIDFLTNTKEKIDVILLDIIMPIMNGKEFLLYHSQNYDIIDIPVVVISALDDAISEVDILNLGANDMISSPYDIRVVRQRVYNAIYRSRNAIVKREQFLLLEQRKVKNRLQAIMDNMNGAVQLIEVYDNRKYKTIYLNKGYYNLFKYEFSLDHIDVFSSSYCNQVDELWDKIYLCIETNQKFYMQLKCINKSSEALWVEVQGCILRYEEADNPVVMIIFNDISNIKQFELEMQKTNEIFKYRANYDKLTGIYNREAFQEKTQIMLHNNPNSKYILLRYNFDKFKFINELLGTDVGDEIFIYFANYLQKKYNKIGTYGRLQSDNFVACIPLELFNEKALQYELDHCFDKMKLNHKINIFVGAYKIQKEDQNLSIMNMIDRAKLALQTYQKDYLHRIYIYKEELREKLLAEQAIVTDMTNAIKNKEFVIYLQPIYLLSKNHVSSAEVLVRWNHPQKGIISPGTFIPLFEKNGFISELDYYVWEEACKYLKNRIDRGLPQIVLSVNISRISLFQNDIVEKLCGLIKKYNLDAEMLELEITESIYTVNPELIISIIKKLKYKGFSILMDDFGSGYSSLNTLKDLPVDILKIDMKFLENFEESHRSASILTIIVKMAKWLNMPTIAEGVETVEQLNFLKGIGCDKIQGYLFSKPVPINEFEKNISVEKTEQKYDIIPFEYNDLFNNNKITNRVFDLVTSGMCFLELENNELKVIRVNNIFYNILGYKTDELFEKNNNFLNIVTYKNKTVFLDLIKNVVSTTSSNHIVLKCIHANGKNLFLDTYIRYIKNENNSQIVCLNFNDITDQVEKNNIILYELFDDVYEIDIDDNCSQLISTHNDDILYRKINNFKTVITKFVNTYVYADDKEHVLNNFMNLFNNEKSIIELSFSYRIIREKLIWYNSTLVNLNSNKYLCCNKIINEESLDKNKTNLKIKKQFLDLLLHNKNVYVFEYECKKDICKIYCMSDNNNYKNIVYNDYINYIRKGNLIHKDYQNNYLDILTQAKNKEINTSIEYYANFNGDFQWYRNDFKSIIDKTGDVIKIIGQAFNITKEVHKRNVYKNIIEHDQLSGLLNRISAEDKIKDIITINNKKFAFFMMDIDKFKIINDTYGHPVGDKVLIKISKTLLNIFKNSTDAIVSRFGGDELVAFFSYKNNKEVSNMADEIITQMGLMSTELQFNVSLSIGIALYPINGSSFDTLFSKADKALYNAKQNGKNCYKWFIESL